jgi:isocitrate lyase
MHTNSQQVNDILSTQVKEIKSWWASERFSHVQRPYSALAVAKLSGTFNLERQYPSHIQAKKLWTLFSHHKKHGTCSCTFGAMDPVQVIQMAKYLDTVYVSGWQCSSTASSTNGKILFRVLFMYFLSFTRTRAGLRRLSDEHGTE